MSNKSLLRLSPLLLPAIAVGLAPLLISGSPISGSVPLAIADPVSVERLMTSLTTTSGTEIRMPEGRLQAVVSRYHIGPNAALPQHKHPRPRYAHVLSGELLVTNEETHRSTPFRAGDTIIEDVGTWHSARNMGSEPVELLVFDFVKPGEVNLVSKD